MVGDKVALLPQKSKGDKRRELGKEKWGSILEVVD